MKMVEKVTSNTIEIKDYNVMIHGRKFFHKTIRNDLKTYDNIN